MRILYIGNDLSDQSKYHSAYATLKQNLIDEGFDVICSSSKKNQIFRLLDMIITVMIQAKKVDYILIDVFSTSAFYYAFVTSQLARIFKTKYVPILHGGNLPSRLDKSPKMSAKIFKNAFINVSPSAYLQTAFKNKDYDSVLISNTINIKDYIFKERSQLAPNLLYVRAFAEIYNPVMAVNVLHELKNTYPKATLCMVGPDRDGTLIKVQERIKELHLEESIIITGVLPKQEWHQLSKNYDVFINTTNIDNTPVSLIETMALGLPIVSTNVGGIPYLIKDKEEAFLVNPNDVEQMTNAIINLLNDKNLANKFSLKGRKKAENMDWEVVKYQWLKVLK
ncbi:glycosyltransferase family 4 protein [Wenyingzhuangia sp. chi5]|uniref:Glycosyltransferase family 4 protein n=1 Tax=Wenyingzhuangia gilva TaxID=3057677 RepID=A0ABT8VT55_9FLAO|nr:glycosyltransferase family 4 protein [Wenyingzhuangia sp. chi5]MDO3695139.1 glycosyltransferase family 4 protein [Wenyingzhuangia sp. chi5]